MYEPNLLEKKTTVEEGHERVQIVKENLKQWKIDISEVLWVIEYLEQKNNEHQKTNTSDVTQKPSVSEELTKLLSTTWKEDDGSNQKLLESDFKNWSIDYVDAYIKDNSTYENKVIAMNVLLQRIGLEHAKVMKSPIEWHYMYIGTSWFIIDFAFWNSYTRILLTQLLTNDVAQLINDWDGRAWSMSDALKTLEKIDQVIQKTKSLLPHNESSPYVDNGKKEVIYFVTSRTKRNILGGGKPVKEKVETGVYSSAQLVKYLNNQRKVFHTEPTTNELASWQPLNYLV